MILVIGESNDVSTNSVVEWLKYYKAKFKRINYSDYTKLNYLNINNEFCKLQFDDVDLSEINVIWNRRGGFSFIPKDIKDNTLLNYLKKEENSLLKSLEDIINKKIEYIGSYHKEIQNYKLDYLLIAKKVGLKIPDTLISNSKKNLLDFYNSYDQIITKDIRYPISMKSDNIGLFSSGTFVIDKQMIKSMSNECAPTLVQEKINKQFELRVFFLKETLFAMAILSQKDEKTQVDYRNYNRQKPNRNIPFRIPEEIKRKIIKFIHKSGLSTGSIDLIVDSSNQYFFLEVNPQGQFDWVSKNCNYYIEDYIANHLINIK